MILQILTLILLTLGILVGIFSAGVYFPYLPKVGEYTSLITSFFSWYSIFITLILFIFSFILLQYSFTNLAVFAFVISLVNLIAWSIPAGSLYLLAYKNNITLSITENLSLKINRGEINIDNSVKYLTRDGVDLYLDYYPAYGDMQTNIKPLIYVHGGGFTGGHRSEEPEMIEFFRDQGYSVFDVGYTLADSENATWDIAGREIQTAVSWVGKNSEKYNLDISNLTIAGSSAGATLALQAAYGRNDEYKPYGEYDYMPVSKVIALFPAADIKTLWDRDTEFYGIRSRDTEYIGGTPAEYPERYERVNTINLADKNAPETLIIHGTSDTLIPLDTVTPLTDKLTDLGVKNKLVAIPFAQHGYTYFSGSLGFQITKSIMADFLTEK